MLLLWAYLVGVWVWAGVGGSPHTHHHHRHPPPPRILVDTLRQVLRVPNYHNYHHRHHQPPPPYMLRLYRGLSKGASNLLPRHANTVTCVTPNKG
ncbi:hypothetical protein Pcinc_027877 [Petrolisthes cinctipes]|uniref:Secreted protein n=1 Tax=Petrolisthes cinctipes TaxID=88211 RepID=A0AAE1F464_PETCI|nr:hypothetical protein Pcinc_027877 [Petrolisthes cinctipes]